MAAARTTARRSSSRHVRRRRRRLRPARVTKVGGVTEFLKVPPCGRGRRDPDAALAVFRPGLPRHASPAGGTRRVGCMIERYHLDLEASLYGELVTPVDGGFVVPDGPGLGRDPDPDVLKTYGA